MTAVLRTKNLLKNFGAVKAADNLNITLESDTTVGLIGSNGAGKTTFLNMVTGYLTPDHGTIYFENENITGKSPRDITRRGVYRSFQIPQVFNTMTVKENLEISVSIGMNQPNYTKHIDETVNNESSIIKNSLQKFKLEEYQEKVASQLPEGTRKLLDISMALVMKPKLLLLDEPTSGVSAEEKFNIMDMVMNAVRSEKIAVLFVEHDMEIIKRYTDRTLAFFNGRVIADGLTNEVLNQENVIENILGSSI